MDKDQLIENLNLSQLYYENGKITCQVCYTDIKSENWPRHKEWHIHLMNSFIYYYEAIKKLERDEM